MDYDSESDYGGCVYTTVHVTKNRLKYSLDQHGLHRNGHYYKQDLCDVLPKFFKNGKRQKGDHRAKRNAHLIEPVGFWQAQCQFRGLHSKGNTQELQFRLSNTTNHELTDDMKEIQRELQAKYANQHKTDQKDAATKRKAKADEDMRKSKAELRRLFPDDQSERLVVRKGDIPSWLTLAAKDLGLTSYIFPDPGPISWDQDWDNWLVISTNAEACRQEVEKLQAEGRKAKEAQEKKLEEARLVREAKEEEDLSATKKRVAKASQLAGGKWDVTGEYRITCEDVTKEYGHVGEVFSLRLHRGGDEQEGLAEMYGQLEFGLYEGYLRFETKDPAHAAQAGENRERLRRKRKRGEERAVRNKLKQLKRDVDSTYETSDESESGEDESDEEEEEQEHEEEDDSDDDDLERNAGNFLLRMDERPSPDAPKWQFRWRGRETGDGKIDGEAEKKLCSIKFKGKGGARIKGTFKTSLGHFKFKGVKVKTGAETAPVLGFLEEWRAVKWYG